MKWITIKIIKSLNFEDLKVYLNLIIHFVSCYQYIVRIDKFIL